VKQLAFAALVLALVFPAMAQTPEPTDPAPTPAPVQPDKPKASIKEKFFFGGGVGAAFGAVDYVEIAPLVGFRVVPRVDLGVQPFYRWTDYGGYSTTDYGTRLFTRVRLVSSFFVEADYQFTSYEQGYTYPNGAIGTTRATNNAFLAGGGYTVPLGRNAGLYFSALYDFTYDNGPNAAYDSPVQFQVGVAVGF
jgi:hypothetical protein